jgi:erythronate-4-phosphate dehydrogenase
VVNIVCASSVRGGPEAFSTLGETRVLPDDQITAAAVRDADALIVRSKTRVGPGLLRGARVAFVGSTTAGIDHLDTEFMEEAGIAWCAAPGANANSVAEYIVAALLHLADRSAVELAGRVLGIIGVGHIGIRVVELAETLGLTVLKNDPPLQEATGDGSFLPLEQMLPHCDIITLHVPLTRHKLWPTFQMANYRFFEMVKPGAIFINTSRGEVVDEDALLDVIHRGVLRGTALDVWNHEPRISGRLLSRVEIGTPHIAGYSFEGLLNGTAMVYHRLCQFFERPPAWRAADFLRGLPPVECALDLRYPDREQALGEAVRVVYPIEEDDRHLKAGIPLDAERRGQLFNRLRSDYPMRREFAAARVRIGDPDPGLRKTLQGLGFSVSNT